MQHIALRSFLLKSYPKMDFLFHLLYHAISFLSQLGKYLLSLYCSIDTTCSVTDNHNTILEQNLSLLHLKQKGFM